MKYLVLFDIDGTLLRCGPQIGPLFVGALVETFGAYTRPPGYNFSGKTDPRIVLDMVESTGRSREEILRRLPEMQPIYFARLEAGLEKKAMRLLPGVLPLLERLKRRSDVLLGLLTGNWQQGARIKLSRFDLGRFFSFGAFGDDAVDRRDLVPVALERAARRSGRSFASDEVFIVGDSELDVDCARAAGVRSIAVATGHTPLERLEQVGADWSFPDLEHAKREMELFQP